MQAHGVPMAVPVVWRHHVVPNWNKLLFITNSSSFMINSCGRLRCVANVCRYSVIIGIPSAGSMFEYMDVASEVSIFEPGGNGPCCWSFLIT